MSESENHIASQPTETPPQGKRSRLRRLLGALAVFSGSLAVLSAWMLFTESGLRFAAFQLPKLAGVSVRADKLSGSVFKGFEAEKVSIATEAADIRLSRAVVAWQPRELWNGHLHIQRITVGDVAIDGKPTPPQPPSEPPELPESIALPFSVTVDELSAGSVSTGGFAYVLGANAVYVYDHVRHRIELKSLDTHWSDSWGEVELSAQKEFALKGELVSQGKLDDIAAKNVIRLSGSLNDININTDLQGEHLFLRADARIMPFAATVGGIIGHLKVEGENLNPRAFVPEWPKAKLGFNVDIGRSDAEDAALEGSLKLRNAAAAPFDRNAIPIRSVDGVLSMNDSGTVNIGRLEALLMKQGRLNVGGSIYAQKQVLNLNAELKGITAADVLSFPLSGSLNGVVRAHGTFERPQADWQIDTGYAAVDGGLKIDSDGVNQTLLLEHLNVLPKNGGSLKGSARMALFGAYELQATLRSEAFNPVKFYPALPEGSVNGEISANGSISANRYHAQMQFDSSRLSGAPLSGSAQVDYESDRLSRADVDIRLGGNHIRSEGAYGKKGDVLALDIDAPNLNLFGFGIKGLLNAKGTLTNTANGWTAVDGKLSGQARGFAFGKWVSARQLDFNAQMSPDYDRPLLLKVDGSGLDAGGVAIEQVHTDLNGTLRRHNLNLSGSLKLDGKPLHIDAAANGGLNHKDQWQGVVGKLNVGGALDLRLHNAVSLQAGAEQVVLGAARWQALGGSLNLNSFEWNARSGITTKGNAENLNLVQLHQFYTPPVEHDLVLSGDWDLSYGNRMSGYLNVRQQAGDVVLPLQRKTPLNLSGLKLNSRFEGNAVRSTFQAATRYGNTEGSFNVLQAFGGDIAASPVSGNIRLVAADLSSLKNLMPIGQSIKGSLNADIQIGGRLGNPQASGSVKGENLSYRNRQVGVVLDNGSLKSRIEGQRWIIESLRFQRKDGSITLSGQASYANETPDVDAKVVFDRYQILDMPGRRLTVSGSSEVSYTAQGIMLDGMLKTDEGRFGFQESTAPQLDGDVVVLGEEKHNETPQLPLKLNFVFDLNDRFYFIGEGLNVNLGGSLKLTSNNSTDIQGVGSVRILSGRYKAYGQDLVVKKGIISFVGPLDNPSLNIRAERRNSPVGAGVEVLGNVNNPRITLVANEPMSEKDRLSWLILNRPSSGTSTDEAALATAAGAFLGGSINDKIGLVDDFGLSSSQTRDAQTGEMNPAQQVLTFGKQLTQDLYLGYEVGLQTASQSVKLVYQLSRSFQAIGRLGTESSGGELKYVKRFD